MDKRILVSTGIALVFVLAWQFVFSPLFFPAKPTAPPAEVQPGAPAPMAGGKTEAVAPGAAPAQDLPEVEGLKLESDTYRLLLTNKGAGIRELTLKASVAREDVTLLASHEGVAPHLALKASGVPEKIQTIGWEVVEKSEHAVTFRVKLSSGIEIRKTFELPADGSRPLMKVKLSNVNAPPEGKKDPAPATAAIEILAINGMEQDSEYRYEQYAAGFAHTELGVEPRPLANVISGEEKIAAAKTQEEWDGAANFLRPEGKQRTWFGTKNRFFAVAVVPDEVTQFRVASIWFRAIPPSQLKSFHDRKGIMASAGLDPVSVGVEPVTWTFSVFASPLQKSALSAIPKGEALMNYGSGCAAGCPGPVAWMFKPMAALIDIVAPLILGVLGLVASVLGNHGVAIMVTTLLIRLCLFPLSKKSQVSMYGIQQLGPKIQALRERYKDDQQKFGMEQMRLYREHKINPLSGCLPMVLQMPIFIAMYSVFEMSFDLRGRNFLWMQLHEPDKLIDWAGGFVVPLVGLNLDAFNLLPLIMTVTWFLQSWFAPRSPDPQMAAQQKMMLAMPVVFGLMCYNLASGLSLYFFVNSLLSMTEQKLIKKFFLKPPGDGPKTA
ncbi:MAG TPA: membrane protein insertase YidC [Planctomycetota bacterium]